MMKVTCPICGKELSAYTDYMDHQLVEYGYECPDKHMEDHYAYGGYTLRIFDEIFQWDYTTPDDKVRELQSNWELAVKNYELWL